MENKFEAERYHFDTNTLKEDTQESMATPVEISYQLIIFLHN